MLNPSIKNPGRNIFKMKNKMDISTKLLFYQKLPFYSLNMKILPEVIS